MKLVPVFSILVMVAVFAAVYGYNTTQPEKINLKPPYAFTPDDITSELMALGFVFAFSLLFFGYAAPLALGIEGAKFGSLITSGAVHWTYLALTVPEMVVAISATYLGQGLLLDYQGQGLWQTYAKRSVILLIIALVLWVAAFYGRRFLG